MSKPPHALRNRPPGQQGAPVSQTHTVTQSWQGPLPHPDALEAFNKIIPNGAERILAMTEAEQRARLANENLGLRAAVAESKRGQVLGAAILIAAIVAAVITAKFGAPWQVPCSLVGVPIVGAVIALITGRRSLDPPSS